MKIYRVDASAVLVEVVELLQPVHGVEGPVELLLEHHIALRRFTAGKCQAHLAVYDL